MTLVQTFATGQELRLQAKLNPGDTSFTADIDVGVDAGRIYFVNNLQEEWVSFTGVAASGSDYVYSGLTRGLSQTADPATAGTGKTWGAGSIGVLVAMHDQMGDKQQATQYHQEALTFATEAARDAALGGNGVCTFNYTDIKVTSTGLFYNYNTTSGQWEVQGTGTATPNASTTVAGSTEIGTQTEVDTPTDTGGSGATVVVIPSTFQQGILNRLASQAEAEAGTDNTKLMSPLRVKQKIDLDVLFYFGNGVDGDVTITGGTTTLTRDMYYNNLTISSTGILNPAGYRIFVKATLTIDSGGKIQRNGNNGGNASAGTGGSAGAALADGTITGCIAGVAGPNGASSGASGTNGTAGNNASPSYSNVNGTVGGTGGGPSPQTGGTGGTSTRGGLYNTIYSLIEVLLLYMHPASFTATLPTTLYPSTQYKTGATGGSGGSGDSNSTGADIGGGGGGSGSSGGIIIIAAHTVNSSGTIEALGGNGGNGGNGTTNAGGGGGGAGGPGGVITVIYRVLTSIGTLTVTGGTAGTGGSGSGTYSAYNGGNGSAGSAGVTIQKAV